MFLLLLGAAVGTPYMMSKGPKLSELSWPIGGSEAEAGNELSEEAAASLEDSESADGRSTGEPRVIQPSDIPLEGFPAYDLAEVLRMDVDPAWVYQRWSRKSTALAELDLYGVRVPLVTGTQVDDLAGSLTYYFDVDNKVQRISFRGRTGDARKLIALVTKRYDFRPQQPDMPGEYLYQVRWNGKPTSELRIRPMPVLWASAPHTSFQVELELARPGSSTFLTRPEPQIGLAEPTTERQ